MEYSKREKKIKFGDVTPGHVVRDDDGAMFLKLKSTALNIHSKEDPCCYNAVDLVDGSLHSFDNDFKVEDVPGIFVEYGVDWDFADDYKKAPPVFTPNEVHKELLKAIDRLDKKTVEPPMNRLMPEWRVYFPETTGGKSVSTTSYPQFNVDSYEGEVNNDSPVIKDCWLSIVRSWETGKGKTKLNEDKE